MKQILSLLVLSTLFASAQGIYRPNGTPPVQNGSCSGTYGVCVDKAPGASDRSVEFVFNGEHYRTLADAETAWSVHFSRALGLVVPEGDPLGNEVNIVNSILFYLSQFSSSENIPTDDLNDLNANIFSKLAPALQEVFVDYGLAEKQPANGSIVIKESNRGNVPNIVDFLKKICSNLQINCNDIDCKGIERVRLRLQLRNAPSAPRPQRTGGN